MERVSVKVRETGKLKGKVKARSREAKHDRKCVGRKAETQRGAIGSQQARQACRGSAEK